MKPGKLSSLTIRFDKWEHVFTNGVPIFLSAVGSSLRFLTVDGLRDDLDERVILDCCPNLESLYLCGGLVDVELSLGEFRIMRQASLQQRIDWQIIASLAAALSDRDNALATCVRRM
ncbi:hypothetical protein JG687_00014532 [Phytophthora cactorum]|uniref:Leucine-rich repeat domain, L domain-like n=1 Tax=Phytophthora cactorum TaxID=29920 RepID=A0A329S433_9STRA|nr:hypothetical protein JG687_00014532 [Phytophthora cactorum]RAW30338.1 hypothetical protein PC110_g13314 [Phytophthora cactorum]